MEEPMYLTGTQATSCSLCIACVRCVACAACAEVDLFSGATAALGLAAFIYFSS
jgi:hypothetical protein